MTILWEHGLGRWVVECLWCLKLCNVKRVCWRKYGRRVGVRLSHRRRRVVLKGGWHGWGWHERCGEMRSVWLVKRVWRDGRRGDQELLYHLFVFFHVGIEMQFCHTVSVPVYETGSPSARHRSVARIFQSSGWTTAWSRVGATKESLSELCLWHGQTDSASEKRHWPVELQYHLLPGLCGFLRGKIRGRRLRKTWLMGEWRKKGETEERIKLHFPIKAAVPPSGPYSTSLVFSPI